MELNLYDSATVERLLKKHGFTFSKALGQNFIIDGSVCPEMAEQLGADSTTGVLEIGPGIGVLTRELCKRAGRVVCVELDTRLLPLLGETLGDFSNLEIVNGDIMKLDLKALIDEKFKGCSSVKVCANLPYYITSPVIMTLLESGLPIDEIVVMVQREAAERLCAETGTRASGAVTVAVDYYGKSEVLFGVGRESFMPPPKVDSAVIRITPRKNGCLRVDDEKAFFTLVKAAFSQRRKTLVNSLSSSGIQKDRLLGALDRLGITPTARAESLTTENFIQLYKELKRYES